MWPHTRMRTLAAIMLIAALSGCSLLSQEVDTVPPPIEPPQRSIKEIFTVRRGDIAERLALRAVVVPAREATLFFGQGGRLRTMRVAPGDTVKAGQLLAELEIGDLETDIALAEISVAKLEIRRQQARERAENGGGPDRHDLAILELDLQAAELHRDLLHRRLEESRLYAPFSGDVTATLGKTGEVVQPFQGLVTLSDPTVTEIQAEVEDLVKGRLVPGQRAQLTFPSLGDRVMEATLVQVGAPDSPQDRGQMVKLVPDEPQPDLAQGMVGRADVILQAKQDVLLLPHTAVRSYVGRTYALVLEEGSRREVDIAVGLVGDTETEILKGLLEGQQVIGR